MVKSKKKATNAEQRINALQEQVKQLKLKDEQRKRTARRNVRVKRAQVTDKPHPTGNDISGDVHPTAGLNRLPVKSSPPQAFEKTSELLTDCEKLFVRARLNPFGSFEKPPCNPVRTAVDSIKIRFREVGTFKTNTSGYGWVMCNPYTVFNDLPTLVYTDGDNGNSVNTTGITGNKHAYWATSPFNSTANSGGFKIVGYQVRVCDIGPLLQTAGLITKWSAPNNTPQTTIVGGEERAIITNLTTQINNQSCYYNSFSSKVIGDDDLHTVGQAVWTNGGVFGFFIQGTPSRTFNWEICAWYEYIPGSSNTLVSLATDSEHSPNGAMIARHARDVNEDSMTLAQQPVKHAEARSTQSILMSLKNTAEKLPIVGPMLKEVEETVESIPIVGDIASGIGSALAAIF